MDSLMCISPITGPVAIMAPLVGEAGDDDCLWLYDQP